MRVFANLLAILCVVVLALPAGAAVMTFNNLPPASPDNGDYREKGITASGNGELGSFNVPAAAHINDAGTAISSRISFTMSSRFDAVGFDILPIATEYCVTPSNAACGDPYDNVLVQGYRDGSLVAENRFYAGDDPNTYLFSLQFLNLDRLIIGGLLPNFSVAGGECVDIPCGQFNIDNVELNAVPLPAALPLYSAALGFLGYLGWRRRRTGNATA